MVTQVSKETLVNPVIIIPTYWSSNPKAEPLSVVQSYDHVSDLSGWGELPRCLFSLRRAGISCRIVIVVVAGPGDERSAYDKVNKITAGFPALDTFVVGSEQAEKVHARMDELGLHQYAKTAALTSYGAIRNLGLIVAAVLGHDQVIFLDDDEVVEDPEFVDKALFGLGKLTRRGVPVLVKTGFFYDRSNRYTASDRHNAGWKQEDAFNRWIEEAMAGARITPSRFVCGGCMAIDREGYRRMGFDPWIPRGEDLDYLLNMRLYGFDVWFDNVWSLKHYPPETADEVLRFRSDYYRWVYEQKKLEHARTQVDLTPISPSDLDPYPGPLLRPQGIARMRTAARFRNYDRRAGFVEQLTESALSRDADAYAEDNCDRFLRFMYAWPEVFGGFEDAAELRDYFDSCIERHREELREHVEEEDAMLRQAQESLGTAEEIAARWARRARREERRPRTRRSLAARAREIVSSGTETPDSAPGGQEDETRDAAVGLGQTPQPPVENTSVAEAD